MPVKRVRADQSGKPGYKFGEKGKVYRYVAGSSRSRARAMKKAHRQGVAVKASMARKARSGG